MLRESGLRKVPQALMLAEAVDLLRWLKWAQTKDGHEGRNRPSSMVEYMTETVSASARPAKKGFATVAEFEAAYRRLTGQDTEE